MKNLRAGAALFLAAVLLFAGFAAPLQARADSLVARGFVTANRADLVDADTGKVIDTLGKNVAVSIFGVLGYRLYVTVPSSGKAGFVDAKKIAIDGASSTIYGIGLLDANVHVRKEATSSSKSVAIAHAEDALILLSFDQNSGWYHVKTFQDVKGYVSTKHVTVICKSSRQ